MRHRDYMQLAIEQALVARELGEVPVGCVIVKEREVIATGYNRRETVNNALAHAEIMAINAACERVNSWRLNGCTIYVTLEPCFMCMGALLNARVDTLVFGVNEDKTGGCGGLINMNEVRFPHRMEVIQGICEIECQALVKSFFKEIRQK